MKRWGVTGHASCPPGAASTTCPCAPRREDTDVAGPQLAAFTWGRLRRPPILPVGWGTPEQRTPGLSVPPLALARLSPRGAALPDGYGGPGARGGERIYGQLDRRGEREGASPGRERAVRFRRSCWALGAAKCWSDIGLEAVTAGNAWLIAAFRCVGGASASHSQARASETPPPFWSPPAALWLGRRIW